VSECLCLRRVQKEERGIERDREEADGHRRDGVAYRGQPELRDLAHERLALVEERPPQLVILLLHLSQRNTKQRQSTPVMGDEAACLLRRGRACER